MASLTMYRGDAREIEVTITFEDDPWVVPGDAVVRATGKRSFQDTDAEAIWTKDDSDGITVVSNVATIELEPEDTDSLATREVQESLHVDVQVTSPTIGPWTVAAFTLVVLPDVTRTQP